MQEYKYLSWGYGVDRKICHEGHWLAPRGLTSDPQKWSRVTDFSIHTIYPWWIFFSCILFDWSYHVKAELAIKFFFFKEHLLKFNEADATNDRRSVLYVNVNLHYLTSFFYVFMNSSAVNTNVTLRRRYVTSYTTNAFNIRDFSRSWVR